MLPVNWVTGMNRTDWDLRPTTAPWARGILAIRHACSCSIDSFILFQFVFRDGSHQDIGVGEGWVMVLPVKAA
jgi:hypothetical protein